jgi:catechol 2,3-dioxygenase-like lactoylglutathione lyase family enzyme
MVSFYRDIMGLQIAHEHPESAEIIAGPVRLFLDQRPNTNVIFEFLVPDLETAKKELVEHGCEVVRWEGKGGCCYLRDPFGMLFNLYEEPRAFGVSVEAGATTN